MRYHATAGGYICHLNLGYWPKPCLITGQIKLLPWSTFYYLDGIDNFHEINTSQCFSLPICWYFSFIICDLSCENVHYGYPFERLQTVHLPFGIRLSSVRDRWDAVWTDWIICSEKFVVIRPAAAICSKKSLSIRKKSSSIRKAEVISSNKILICLKKMVICSKKIVICSNSWGYPFEKNAAVQMADVIRLIELQWFQQLMSPVRENSIQLFKRLLPSIHTKLISGSIGQRYPMGFTGFSNGCVRLQRTFNLSDSNGHVCPFWKKNCI